MPENWLDSSSIFKKKKGLRVLIYTGDFDPIVGGIGTTVKESFSTLDLSQNVEPAVIYPFFHTEDYYCLKVGSKSFVFSISDKQAEKDVINFVKKHFQVIHVHTPSKWFMENLMGTGIPIVYTCHGIFKQMIEMEKGVLDVYLDVFRGGQKRQEEIFAKSVYVVVFTSTGRKILQDFYPQVDPVIIPNGIHTNRIPVNNNDSCEFRPYLKKKHINILFLGGFYYAKGIENLIETGIILRKKIKDFLIIIAGHSSANKPEYNQSLIKRISNELYDNVLCVDWADRDLRNKLFRLSDVFVHPSLYEGFPNAVLEAMAAKVPIVASSVGGINDMLEHGETGLLVDPGDNGGMADAVLKIMRNPNLQSKITTKAYHKVGGEYNWKRVNYMYLSLYKEAIGKKSKEKGVK